MTKSLNEIVLDMIDYVGTALPDADTKAGTVIRDLMVDLPASQLSLLYGEISNISNLQSLRLVAGSDLEKLAQNLGATRKVSTAASGLGLFTFSSIPATVAINAGEIITAANGTTFTVINGLSVDVSKANFYRSIATKYQNDLSFLGITDQYAVEVSLKATVPGQVGNISKYSLVRSNVPGASNITNVFSFTGGTDQENDASFRNRVLAIFSGSNIGTALGYKNTALTNSFVQDALVIEPGDVLMTRDGTIVGTNSEGKDIIISEGTGGKVDIVILGSNLNENIDTFIYKDKSNNNDPTDPSNNVILGQIVGDENKTITRKRIDDIAAGILPSQPVENLLEITGTLSGDFIPKSVDELGRISGNYELVKDTGVYKGSPWAQDYFKWIDNKISLYSEDIIKTQFNGQDPTTFTDVIDIPKIQQTIVINNENSNVIDTDRSIVQLLHTPSGTVNRVLNTNTGERYTVINQNFDGTPTNNATGRIQISGNTLPSSSDILQVDYTWIIDYDPFSDFDGKILKNNPRSSVDSIDWGLSNNIRSEKILFTLNGDNTLYTGTSLQPVSSIISANSFELIGGAVSQSSVVNFSNRLAIVLTAIDNPILNIDNIKLAGTQQDLFNTASADGLFINNRVVVGTSIKYNSTIILPSDAKSAINDEVEIIFNTTDVFNITGSVGSFVGNFLTIPVSNISSAPPQINLYLNYISSSLDLLSFGINNLPISRLGNGFIVNSNVGGKNNSLDNCFERQNQTVQKNGSNQYYIKLNLSSNSYTLTVNDVISVLNINTRLEYWNSGSIGTISTDTDGNYLLIFTGINSPAIGDNVLAIFSFKDNLRLQPFTFTNNLIKYNLQTLDFDFNNNKFFCNLNTFTDDTSLDFKIINPSTGTFISTGSDGYISSTDGYEAIVFSSLSTDFSSIPNINGKKILIDNSSNLNNNSNFIITSLVNLNTVNISAQMGSVLPEQISLIRLSDNKDLWNPLTCTISNNILTLPNTTIATQGDRVMVLVNNTKALHQSPSRLSVNLTDQLTNSGILTINGTTSTQVQNSILISTQVGLKQNLIQAVKDATGLLSTNTLSSNLSIIRLVKLEKVSITSNNEVISSDFTYDVNGTTINNNIFYSNEMNYDGSLSNMDFILPSTVNNLDNAPEIGTALRATFYFATKNDSENLFFTRNGTLITNKKFALVNKIFVSSGFNSSQSAGFTVSFFTQPATGSRYRAFYDYLAPKQNERILIRSNYNQAITDTTFAVEASRPINADVLVRAASEVLIDATINIVIKSSFSTSSPIVIQNTKDRITSTINSSSLGSSINSSDLIVAAQSVDGVDRARIIYFNKADQLGQVLTITAKNDEFLSANDILINQEAR